MKKQEIATSFTKYTIENLAGKAKSINTALTGNVFYTTPRPTLKALLTATTTFEATITNKPSLKNTFDRWEARMALISILNQLAMYVTITTPDNLAAYITSGFSLTKLPAPVGILPKPSLFSVTPCHAGSMKMSLRTIAGADSYSFEYMLLSATAPAAWLCVVSTKADILVSGLQSGSQYAFRVAGIGSSAIRVYSDQLISFVL